MEEEIIKVVRTEEYSKLWDSIDSCKDFRQIDTLRESVLSYHREKKQDSAELLAKFTEKEHDLFVE